MSARGIRGSVTFEQLVEALAIETSPDTDADVLALLKGGAGRRILVSDVLKFATRHFSYPSGHFIYPAGGAVGSSTVVIAANTLYACPFEIGYPTTIVAVALEVTTAAAGNARLGLYRHDHATGKPGALVLDAGTVATGTTGVKSITISQLLEPGKYWVAAVHDAAPTLRAINQQVHGWLHGASVNNATAAGSHLVGLSVAFTYAALPDPFTGGAAFGTTIPRFVMGL